MRRSKIDNALALDPFNPPEAAHLPAGWELPQRGTLHQPPDPPAQDNGPQGDLQQLSSSVKLVSGMPQTLVNWNSPGKPENVGIFVNAPQQLQGPTFRNAGIILDDSGAPGNELWILGECVVGMGGTSWRFFFDIPMNQAVRLQVVAESVVVTARLILTPIPTDEGGGIQSFDAFDTPPLFQGQTEGGEPVYVTGMAGVGVGGQTNATRRMRIPGITAMLNASLPIPAFATMVRVLAEGKTLATWEIQTPTATLEAGPFTIPIGDDFPIPEGSAFLNLAPGSGVMSTDAEVVWRLGLSGFPN